MTPTVSALLFMYTIAAVGAVIVFLDWYTRRKDRRSKQPRLPL
jgi:hypothetical protein